MKKYNLINNTFGWLTFAIAAVVYLMTIEPTASFWDCGEFITSAYKLEVGHPPGAPFFMLTGKFFTLFASDPSQVALMVNAMSAILSAFTILFLFWTITHFAKKLILSSDNEEITTGQMIAIMGSGLVGALAYTFSDTFWFSAVEGEVYAYSSLFTALVFWLIIKWENAADKPQSDRWLILIAYAMGLSIGVHLLNLLCIPAIVLVYYFKKTEKANAKGTLIALLVSFALVVILMFGVIPGFTKVGGWFELFFVNSLGFSFDTGLFAYLILLVASIVWCIYETMASKVNQTRARISFLLSATLAGVVFIGSSAILWILLLAAAIAFLFYYKKADVRVLNTSILCLLVILIGYSSFALIPIRSRANTPMDQNSPEDVFSLADYLNREQYGDVPLFYGITYASQVKRDYQGNAIEKSVKEKYGKAPKKSKDEKDYYSIVSTQPEYEYDNTMLFPRMHSSNERHMDGYKMWGGVENPEVPPTMLENMRYFFDYQVNFMYWRYFMWNFAGRQNNVQNMGGINNGNWMTGIKFFDQYILGLGDQDNLPPSIAENKGHNVYYMLPLLMGILGIAFQVTRKGKGEQQFLVTFMLFFMTGLAIIFYLNQKPFEPRERDYAYAGSFYAFTIWIGLSVAALWTLLKKVAPETISAVAVTAVALLVPIQMASQNWDDHDRSNRYTMRDFGMNYLRSCEPNAIIFTNGDNDTFPLWYAQEVEGFRTDVRVCNLSYFQTEWYIDQMRRESYDSKPLPISWTKEQYFGDRAVYAVVMTKQRIESAVRERHAQENNQFGARPLNMADYYDVNAFQDQLDLGELLNTLKTNESYVPRNPFMPDNTGYMIPTDRLSLKIDPSKVDWVKLGSQPSSELIINLSKKNALYRNELMILEMLNNISKDGWKRPIYFATTVDSDMYLNLQDQFSLEGMSYRILPGVTNPTGVNTDAAFDNMVNKFTWGGIENPKVYLDENNMRMCKSYRLFFSQLVYALMHEGKNDKAIAALDACLAKIPNATVPLEGEAIPLGEAYFTLGKPEKAMPVLEAIESRSLKTIAWYNSLKPTQMAGCSREIAENFSNLMKIATLYIANGKVEKGEKIMTQLQSYAQVYFMNDNAPLGGYALKSLADNAIRSTQQSNDTAFVKEQERIFQKTLALMEKLSPALLNEYYAQHQ